MVSELSVKIVTMEYNWVVQTVELMLDSAALIILLVKNQFVLLYVEIRRNMEHNNAIMVKILAVQHVSQIEDSAVLGKQGKNLYAKPFVGTDTKQVLKNAITETKQAALVVKLIQIMLADNLEPYLFAHLNDLKIKLSLLNFRI